MEELRVADFFCGLGGNSVALELLAPIIGIQFDFRHAFDVSDACIKAYKTNFPKAKVHHQAIEHLKSKVIEDLKCDIWLLSPPCQPFTSGGKNLGEDDPRCAGLQNLLTIFKDLKILPKYIFLENVPQFADSSLRHKLISLLESKRYDGQEYIVQPTAVGCPNSRSRYYLLAWLRNELQETRREKGLDFPPVEKELPPASLSALGYYNPPQMRPMGDYLEYYEDREIGWRDRHESSVKTQDGAYGLTYQLKELIVPDSRIRNLPGIKFEVVTAASLLSTTFTGGYGQLIAKSGPVLALMKTGSDDESLEREAKKPKTEEGAGASDLRFHQVDPDKEKLRHFSPSEIMRLHGFPKSYKVPESIRCRKLWNLLGNSVNINVVKVLLHHLISQ